MQRRYTNGTTNMSNSTDNLENTDTLAKKPKKKGPIRFERILPVGIILALIFVYFSFFLDTHLRRGLEWGLTQVYGAEVNIAKVRTRFFKGSFGIFGLEMTDKDQPTRNLLQIDKMHFGFSWDALLRAKYVINDASITNIQAYTPRKKPGKILPPKPESDNSLLAEIERKVKSQISGKLEGNVFGDIAGLLSGANPMDEIKNIQGELKTIARIQELEKEMGEKKTAWNERIASLPNPGDIDNLWNRFQGIRFDPNNPVAFAQSITEANNIVNEIKQKGESVQNSAEGIKGEFGQMTSTFEELNQMALNDFESLSARFKIPSIDADALTKNLFGSMFQEKMMGLHKYIEMGRQYMPAKSEKAKTPKLIPPKRGEGQDFRFPITKGYPTFWLKYAAISSTLGASPHDGNIEGSLNDFTTSPPMVGRPAIAQLSGDFPQQSLEGILLKATFDHTGETAKESFEAGIQTFPVGRLPFSESDDVRFVINRAKGNSELKASFEGDQFNVSWDNGLRNVEYEIDSKSTIVKDLLTSVSAELSTITVGAKAKGTWDNIDWTMGSNLGEALSNAIKKQIQAKIDEARAKLKERIDTEINQAKGRLLGEFDQLKSQVTGDLESRLGQINSLKSKIENQINIEKEKANQATQQQGQKALGEEGKKVLQKLGF